MCSLMSGLLHQEPGIDLEGLLQSVRKRKTGLLLNANRSKMAAHKHLCSTNFSVIILHSKFVNYLDLMNDGRHSRFGLSPQFFISTVLPTTHSLE